MVAPAMPLSEPGRRVVRGTKCRNRRAGPDAVLKTNQAFQIETPHRASQRSVAFGLRAIVWPVSAARDRLVFDAVAARAGDLVAGAV